MVRDMLIALALLLPVLLMLLLLAMERVERRLRLDQVGAELEAFLESARPDDIEVFVSQGFRPALDGYWRRRRHGRPARR